MIIVEIIKAKSVILVDWSVVVEKTDVTVIFYSISQHRYDIYYKNDK